MGVHICPYILKEKVTDDYGDTYWETDEFNVVDHIRCTGDRDFGTTDEIEWDEELGWFKEKNEVSQKIEDEYDYEMDI